MELIEELKLALVNTGFVLKTLVKIMLLHLVNVTESEVSLVLEQLLVICTTEFPTVVLVKMIRLQNPWQKFSCKNRDSFDNKRTWLTVFFACKDPMFLLSKPTFITMRVEDLDKKFAL
jgi:DNA mismatch repair protein MutL